MKTNPLPDPGKPVTTQQELLDVIESGGVCKECLNEDFDSCVCPEPEKQSTTAPPAPVTQRDGQ